MHSISSLEGVLINLLAAVRVFLDLPYTELFSFFTKLLIENEVKHFKSSHWGSKLIDIEDEMKVRPFMDKRISQEVDASCLGNEWKGYVFRVSGGNDKQGFPK